MMAAMRWVLLVAASLVIPLACGGRTDGGGDDGGPTGTHDSGSSGASSGSSGLGDDGDFPICPSDLPVIGTACDQVDLVCRYQDRSGCQATICRMDGTWGPDAC
jgi:hypothetical protein